MSTAAARLTTELEAAALRALQRAYEDANQLHFRGQLRPPVLRLSDGSGRLGRWCADCRTIELARSLLLEQGWGVVLEVLKHEMAHQYVDEVLGLREPTAHGPAFREVCAARAIDAHAAGLPEAKPTGELEHRILDRIAKLLALASSPNVHEAHSAALAAQRLMLKYNLELLREGQKQRYGFRHLGRPTGRVSEAERILAALLGDHFFVQVIWVPVWRPLEGKRGSVLEVCGTPENLELAEYAYSFLTHTAEQLWREYRRQRRLAGDTGRRAYLAGVMAGFREKLKSQQRIHQQQGLVWVGDGELAKYFRKRHPRVRYAYYGGQRRTGEFVDGREAGRRIVMHRGIARGPSGGVRLLPGRRTC